MLSLELITILKMSNCFVFQGFEMAFLVMVQDIVRPRKWLFIITEGDMFLIIIKEANITENFETIVYVIPLTHTCFLMF